jgi:hypothetical protein
MTCFTYDEAVYAYEQRRLFRPYKKIAKELGKSERSTIRAIGYIALERGTYGSAWRQACREHKRERAHRHYTRCTERDRKHKIAVQSAAEHLEMVRLAGAALDLPPRETEQRGKHGWNVKR